MKKNKKILSVTQYEKCNSLTGIFFMVSGIFYSSRRFEKNLPVLLIFIVISILAVIFTIVQHFGYDREELDEMANENLNTASRIVLMEEMLIGVGVMIVDFLVDMSKVVLSKELTVGNYMMLNHASCVMFITGFQIFMTSFHFRRLERE